MPIVSQIEVRYCEDCQWCSYEKGRVEFAKCRHPSCDLDGSTFVSRKGQGQYCSLARNGIRAACGPEAKYFKEREIIRVPVARQWWHFWRCSEAVTGERNE